MHLDKLYFVVVSLNSYSEFAFKRSSWNTLIYWFIIYEKNINWPHLTIIIKYFNNNNYECTIIIIEIIFRKFFYYKINNQLSVQIRLYWRYIIIAKFNDLRLRLSHRRILIWKPRWISHSSKFLQSKICFLLT